jgi:cytochrome b561
MSRSMNDLDADHVKQPAQASSATHGSQGRDAGISNVPDHSEAWLITAEYTRTAKAYHWITAVAVIGLFVVGWYMTALELSPMTLVLYTWHRWLGITVLALTVVRLLWRLARPTPALPSNMSPFMRFAAYLGHVGLYIFLVVVPLLGWAGSSAAGFPVVLFGLWPLPSLVSENPDMAQTLERAHWASGWLFAVIIVGHAGAAILHHIVKRDDVLRRMLP